MDGMVRTTGGKDGIGGFWCFFMGWDGVGNLEVGKALEPRKHWHAGLRQAIETFRVSCGVET